MKKLDTTLGDSADSSDSGFGQLLNTFGNTDGLKNGLSLYQADVEKCTLDFKEGN